MSRVLHTAQALVDIVVSVPHLPAPGQNVNAIGMPAAYAGGAVNILVAAARTGATAVHGGAHGTGPNGDLIRRTLQADGVELAAAPTRTKDTGQCYVFVEPTGERTFVTTYGAERDISTDSLATLRPQRADLVCVSGYSLFNPTRDPLLCWLETLPLDVPTVLDPGAPFAQFDAELRTRMLALTTVWTGNAQEARELTGLADAPRAETLHAIRELLPRQDAVVIIRDGDRGCSLLVDDEVIDVPGFPQTPVDTNGAGDAHTGILLGERALGADWATAARRANAGAAIKVTRHGPASAPTRAEVDAFLTQRR